MSRSSRSSCSCDSRFPRFTNWRSSSSVSPARSVDGLRLRRRLKLRSRQVGNKREQILRNMGAIIECDGKNIY